MARAQECAPHWLPGQGVPGVDGTVNAMVVIPAGLPGEGDVIVGGSFTIAGNAIARNIARYTPSTGHWATMGSGTTPYQSGHSGIVEALAVLPNGDVLVGGQFARAGGVATSNIARYSPSTNEWFALGDGLKPANWWDYGYVSTITITSDGDAIVGGYFADADGVPVGNIARYSLADQAWSAFGTGCYGAIRGIVALPEGDVVVGGYFDAFNGQPIHGLARYHAASGTWTDAGFGDFGFADHLAMLADGDVVVAGTPWGELVRYSPASNSWSSMGPDTIGSFEVYTLAPLSNGDLIIGGYGRWGQGVAAGNIFRYVAASDTFASMGAGANDIVTALTVLPDGDVLVGGRFTNAGGALASGIVRCDLVNESWTSLASGTDGAVGAMVTLDDGDVLAFGGFSVICAVPANKVARYHPATNTWIGMDWPLTGTRAWATGIARLANGDVIVAGGFASIAGVEASNIARFSPTTGVWSALGDGVSGEYVSVRAVLEMPDGELVVAGAFEMAGDVATRGIARFTPTSNTWSPLGTGVDGTIGALALLANGDILAGGWFTEVDGVQADTVARYNPASGTWSGVAPLPVDMAKTVTDMKVLPGGEVLVAGIFSTEDRGDWGYAAWYDPVSNTWAEQVAIARSGFINELTLLPEGDVLLSGDFGSLNDVPMRAIARYSPMTGAVSLLESELSGNAYSLRVSDVEVLGNGDLLIGGGFTAAGGGASAYVARYTFGEPGCAECSPCAADFDQDGGVTGADIGAFFVDYEQGAACADVDQNGGVDGGDLAFFFQVYEAGGC